MGRGIGRGRPAFAAGVLAVVLGAQAFAAEFAPWGPTEEWKVERGRVAPWAPAGTPLPSKDGLAGQTIRVEGDGIVAAQPLGCANAKYEFVVSPAAGLFEGSLPAPAERSARDLGIKELPVLTMRVACDTGSFDYHRVAERQVMMGLDDIVWSLSLVSSATSPEERVLELLRLHMTGEMGFTPASVARKKDLLTPALSGEIAAYFARPVPKDEVPPINGDPFTNSQEYPERFELGGAKTEGDRSTVPVRFDFAGQPRLVVAVLVKTSGAWRLDDLRYEDGSTFRALLKPDPAG